MNKTYFLNEEGLAKIKEFGKVYDFSIQEGDNHWGIVEGIIAHNCHEVSLSPYSFCNLTEINGSNIENEEDSVIPCDPGNCFDGMRDANSRAEQRRFSGERQQQYQPARPGRNRRDRHPRADLRADQP